MINQGRYIIQASLLLFLLLCVLFLFKKVVTTNPGERDTSAIISGYNSTSVATGIGKSLFQQNCASCHNLIKDLTGPALSGLEERGPWKNRQKLYDWIHNPPKFMTGDDYVKGLREKFGVMMTSFPNLQEKDIDAIVEYINSAQKDGRRSVVVPGFIPIL